jgi:hypothetical protein
MAKTLSTGFRTPGAKINQQKIVVRVRIKAVELIKVPIDSSIPEKTRRLAFVRPNLTQAQRRTVTIPTGCCEIVFFADH